jgi:hypothetical protein
MAAIAIEAAAVVFPAALGGGVVVVTPASRRDANRMRPHANLGRTVHES